MQKTVYEMRISDLSSDVCSSDLRAGERHRAQPAIVGGAIVDEDVSAARVRRDQPVRAGTAIIECDATDFLADPAEPGRVDQRRRDLGFGIGVERSEEHTSELQSLMRISYAVFCLKKNNN